MDRKAKLLKAGCGEPTVMSQAGRVGSKPGEGAEDGHGHRAPLCALVPGDSVPGDSVPGDSDEVSSFLRLKFGPCELDMGPYSMPDNKHL